MKPENQFKKDMKGLLHSMSAADFINKRNRAFIKAALLICLALLANYYGYTWVNYICYPIAAFFVYMGVAFTMFAKGLHKKHL